MGICPFHQNFPAKYLIFETIEGNIPILKLDFWTIELYRTEKKNNNNNKIK